MNPTILRGGEPSPVALQELHARGVKVVIDLREPGRLTDRERLLTGQLGMQYVNVPMPALLAPSQDQLRKVLLLLLNHGDAPVFVHCWRGKDRTGTVVACYRIQHDGWDNARALAEANEYGMSYLERSMRSFILHFSPMSNATLYPVAPSIPPR